MTVLEAIRTGRAVYDWAPLDVERVRLWVFSDALKVDGVRVNVTAEEAQRAADLLGACLTTPRIEDLIWQRAAVRIPAFPGDVTRKTAAEHSAEIDAAIGGRPGLVATVGKSWVLSNRLSPLAACNYGWHTSAAPYRAATLAGVSVWQQPGYRHNPRHRDYSQTLRLVRRRCLVDGLEADLRDVLTDPVLAPLVSHEGPLRVLRQPGVAELEQRDTEPAPPPSSSGQVLVLPEVTIYGTPPPRSVAEVTFGDVVGIPFRQARNFTRGPRSDVRWLVIHTAECGEVKNAAENLAAWAAGPQAPRASWHYAVDSDSITQSVRERDIAWHAPGANGKGIGIEHAGRAAQQSAQWDDAYSRAVLERSAKLAAGICARWQIPIRRVGKAELRAGIPGICGHHDVSLAFRKSTHTDPGADFPWDRYLELVAQEAG